jgi:5-(carboxyamino)imidazole ribonucleotide mutase
MQGEDALWSIVQMPKGVPVATVAIGGAFNAGLLAAQILGVADPALADRMKRFKESQRSKVIRG